MTITQLEYIVALDAFRHFSAASAHCFVTQPTLSMQVQKLEEELGIKIFDRSKQPVIPTEVGAEIIEQARKILAEKNTIHEIVQARQGRLAGELKIGIIPTLAPYLLPLFIQRFNKNHPGVKLLVQEMMTEQIVTRLREGRIDVGLLVTPLQEPGIKEHLLFYEELVAYVSQKNKAYGKKYVLSQDIDPNKLWLLEEGHCFRSQILNLCELRKSVSTQFEYEAGSIETLRRMVELNDGITILPELTTLEMTARQLKLIRRFRQPVPMREVSLVVHRDFVKKRLIEVLKEEIITTLPEKIRKNKATNIVPI
ncbi:MAG: LysR family transcriptional regulator [Chitinophagaceae bacterium]|nr:LysR family transcriptional regulator [Chitinophagaceae bacterium]